MNEMKELHSGAVYNPMKEEYLAEQKRCMRLLYEFNRMGPDEQEKRDALMHDMFAEVGEGCYIEPPLHANWGGKFLHLGRAVYCNFNLTLVDDTHIYLGDHVLVGPGVIFATANHPEQPELRRQGFQYNKAIVVEENVWIGAGAILLPGVTVGKNSIIGAGSVVTRDIPQNVLAVGNPCRVLRELNAAGE